MLFGPIAMYYIRKVHGSKKLSFFVYLSDCPVIGFSVFLQKKIYTYDLFSKYNLFN